MLGLYNSISKSKKEKYGPEFAKEWIKDGLKHHDRFHSEYLSVHASEELADEWKLRFEPESTEEELEEISTVGGGSVEGHTGNAFKRDDKKSKKKKKNLREDDELIDEIADYLLSKLGV
jgi:DNA segregation ATPase FtsK/SpoIIIE-like protein